MATQEAKAHTPARTLKDKLLEPPKSNSGVLSRERLDRSQRRWTDTAKKKVTVVARGRPKSFTIFLSGGVVSTRKLTADGRNGQDGR